MQEINRHVDDCLGPETESEDLLRPYKNDLMDIEAKIADEAKQSYKCPICHACVTTDLKGFNSHIDSCLNSNTIKEILKSENQAERFVFSLRFCERMSVLCMILIVDIHYLCHMLFILFHSPRFVTVIVQIKYISILKQCVRFFLIVFLLACQKRS